MAPWGRYDFSHSSYYGVKKWQQLCWGVTWDKLASGPVPLTFSLLITNWAMNKPSPRCPIRYSGLSHSPESQLPSLHLHRSPSRLLGSTAVPLLIRCPVPLLVDCYFPFSWHGQSTFHFSVPPFHWKCERGIPILSMISLSLALAPTSSVLLFSDAGKNPTFFHRH